MTQPLDHLDDERLLLELYGAGGEADRVHLARCPECAARFTHLKARRARLLAEPAAPPNADRLRAQRAAVWAQIGSSRKRPLWRALQASAAACAVLAAILLYRPAMTPPVQPDQEVAQLSDAQLFEELATMLASETPVAAEPIKGLFASAQESEVQQR